MKDFNDIPNKEQYMPQSVTDPETGVTTFISGKWVAFSATETEATVLGFADSIPELTALPTLDGVENYIIHKF